MEGKKIIFPIGFTVHHSHSYWGGSKVATFRDFLLFSQGIRKNLSSGAGGGGPLGQLAFWRMKFDKCNLIYEILNKPLDKCM